MNELTPEQLSAISNAIYSGNKIEAIKLYRSATGEDLKDSKKSVEKLTAELMTQNPTRFARQRRQSGSLATWCFGALSPWSLFTSYSSGPDSVASH